MILINTDKESFYSLTNEGSPQKIYGFKNREQWFNAISEMSELLETACNNKEIIFLYRGENRNTFWEKTGTNFDYTNDPHYDRFFIIGSKAKSYLEDKDDNIRIIKQFESDSKTQYIFNKLNGLSENKEYKIILSYFQCKENFDDFKEKMLKISNDDHRLTIENFFLAFIHTISSEPEDINAYSVLISSTRNVEVSKTFANEGYIIAFWLSKPIKNQAIDYYNIENYNSLLSRYNIPMIDIVHFSDESEVTVFSAIFPHNIFYVYDISRKKHIFNPYIIKTDLNDFIIRGINVDQRNFNETLKGIYSRSIWRSDSRLLYEK